MEKQVLIFLALFVFDQECVKAMDVNDTAIENVDGEYLLKIGKLLNKPVLYLIGTAMMQVHPCGAWTTWTACTAKRNDHFGIRQRTRECGVHKNIERTGETKIEKDFSICEGVCTDNYTLTTNGFCIKVYTTTKSHEDAGKQCNADGGNLILLDTDIKYGDVQNLTGLPTTYMHIDGSRKDTTSPWIFTKGSNNGFFKWESGQPNDSAEACLLLKGSSGTMYDGNCSTTRPFICEKSI